MLDAHHHLWDVSARRYPWLAGGQLWATDEELAPLRRSFTLADLTPLAARSGITATIVVQTTDESWETPDLLAFAAGQDPWHRGALPSPAVGVGTVPDQAPGATQTVRHQAPDATQTVPDQVADLAGTGSALIDAVVGWTDLTAPGVADALDGLAALPGGAALRGIRHPLLAEPDPDWLDRPAVRRGLHAVANAGLCFDLVVRPDQLRSAVATAREVPALKFVLDHLGGPPVDSGPVSGPPIGSGPVSGPWADAIRALGALPNVACKLSGAHTDPLSAAALRPYYAVALEAFGPDRLMFGSDWPVSALTAPYADVVTLYRTLTADLTPAERESIFEHTARRVYRLPG